MKNIKSKIIAGMTAFALLFGIFFAVHAMQKQSKVKQTSLTTQWFVFTGDPNDAEQIEDPASYEPYVPTMTNPEPTCEEGANLCAVKTEPDASNSNIPDEESLKDLLDRNQGPAPDRDEIKHKN